MVAAQRDQELIEVRRACAVTLGNRSCECANLRLESGAGVGRSLGLRIE
jgi:hypothetical protein